MNVESVTGSSGAKPCQDEPISLPVYPGEETLFRFLLNTIGKYRENIAYIYSAGDEEHRVTYGKLFEDVLLLARAFQRRGVSSGDRVMVLSDNRYAWIVTDLALMSCGAVTVPRGADTPTQELQYILENAQCGFLVTETEELHERHREVVETHQKLKKVFIMTGSAGRSWFSSVFTYNDLLADRRYSHEDVEKFLQEGEKLTPQNLLTIIYTSGTTGMPKGVQLTHANIMHNVEVVPGVIALNEQDSWLSILPSWHIFERTAEYVALSRGTSLVYSSVKNFALDLERYRPTLVATVPRVWESLYGKVHLTVKKKGPAAARLFHALLWISSAYRRNRRIIFNRLPVFSVDRFLGGWPERIGAGAKMILLYPFYRLADKKLKTVRDRFGGRLRLAISGGGTLAGYLEEWIDAVGIRIVNAYGMTECSPAIAGRSVNCRVFGTVGPPVARTELRVVSEEGTVLPPGIEGTIEVRGPQVTAGYYQNEEENRKSFTADGFFKTGDLGRLTISGELQITGRAKEVIVLSSGENVDPTRIENALTMFPFIQDAILVGQDKKGLGALLVPNIDELKSYLSVKMSDFARDKADFLTDVKVLDQVRNELNHILRPKQGFKAHEKLKGIRFLDREFSLGEELTNTLKKKRHVIEKKYRQLINELLP
jgi:long-chain acyl-CoA synthetase